MQRFEQAMTLDQLPRDTVARVESIGLVGAERRRMYDLGIIPGTLIVVEVQSPLGDPTAYRVRDAVVALRREQAQRIRITAITEGNAS
jgi:Fe2+ transport system protein FeoA